MAQENIDFGAYPNDPDADAVRVAFQKVQNNFSELFSTSLTTGVDQVIAGTGITVDQNIGNVTVTARIPQITIQTGDSLRIGVGVATTNTATISSGSTPFVITLSNTINTVNVVATGNLVGKFAANSSSQPNITSVGTLSSLSVSGNINAQNIIGNVVATSLSATYLGSPGANTQVVYNYQGNLTATSGLTFDGANLTASNRVQAGNLSITGNANVNILNANYIYGDGSNLTNVNIATAGTLSAPNLLATGNLVGTLAANASSQPNITSVGILTSLSVTGTSTLSDIVSSGDVSIVGNIDAGEVHATYLYGDGSNLTNLSTPTSFSAGNVSVTGNLTGRLSADSALQPNITTVGALTNLSVVGTVSTANVAATYISASGNISAPGTNTQVVFNNQGNLAGSANLVFTGSNLNVAANLNATGNISGNNLTLAGKISATGNISTAGNITTAGNLSVSGNVAITGSATLAGNLETNSTITAGTLSSIGNIDSGGNLNANSVTLSGEANANVVRAVYLIGDGSNISNVGTVVPRNEITRTGSYVTIDVNGYIHGGDSVNGDQFIVKGANGLQALNQFSITDGTANYFSSNTTDASFNLGQNFEGSSFTVECQDNVGAQLQIFAPSGGVGNSEAWLGANTVTIAGTGTANAKLSSINLTGSTISVVGNLVMNGSPASSTNNTQVATTAFVQTVVGAKANLASPTFSGTPTAPTPANGTNNTQIATTQFVANAIAAGVGAGGGANISNGNSSVSTFSDGNVRILAGNGAGTPSTFNISLNDGTNTNTFNITSGSGNPNAVQTTITSNARATAFNIVAGANAYFGNMTLYPTAISMNHPSVVQVTTPTFLVAGTTNFNGNVGIGSTTSFNLNIFGANANLNMSGANSKILLSGAIPANASNTMVPTTAWVTTYTQTALSGAISNAVTSNNFVLTKIGPSSGTNTGSIINNETLATNLSYANMYFPIVLGTQDFTFEGWFKYTSIGATNGTLFGIGGGSSDIIVRIVGTTLSLSIYGVTASLGTAPATNTWFHVAVSKNTGTIRVFLDGISKYTTASYAQNSLGSDMLLGQQAYTAGTYFNGLITNVRFVAGTGVYSSNFTPSTSALTAINGTTLLLLTQNLATVNFDNSGNYRFNNMFQSNFGYSTDSPITTQTNQLTITAPITLPASYTMRLPGNLGSNGQVLSTDGTGNLNWANAGGGSTGNISLISTAKSSVETGTLANAGYIQAFVSNGNTRTKSFEINNTGDITFGGKVLTYGDIRVNANIGNLVDPFNSNIAIGATSIALNSNNIVSSGNLSVIGNTILGSNAKVKITGGTSGQVLSTDGTGNLSWISAGGGSNGGGGTSISNSSSVVSTFAYGQVTISTGAMQAVYSNTGVSMATGDVTLGNGNIILSNGALSVTGNATVTGTLRTTTQASTDNSNAVATTEFVNTVVGNISTILTKNANGTQNVSEILTARDSNGAGYIQAYIVQTSGIRKRVLNIDSNSNITLSGNTSVNGDISTTGNIVNQNYPNTNVLFGSNSLTLNANSIALGGNSNVKITGGSSGQVLSTDGTGNLSWVAQSGGGGGSSSYTGFKNHIINGAFTVWQRGTSFSFSGNDYSFFCADRWFLYAGCPSTFVQSTDVPQGFAYSAKVGRPASQTSAGETYICSNIEYANFVDLTGKTITVSFWAKKGANFSGDQKLYSEIFTGTVQDQGGNAGINNLWTGSVKFRTPGTTLTTTWTKYSYTYTIPANAKSMAIDFGCQSAGTAGADDNFYITGIQMEEGTTATSYDVIPVTTEIGRCQRYFCKNSSINVVATNGLVYTSTGAFSSGAIGAYGPNAGYVNWIPFPVPMFRTPVPNNVKFINCGGLATSPAANQWSVYNSGVWVNSTQIGPQSITDSGMGIQIAGSWPAGSSLWYGAWTVATEI